jgi:hypothetical protein
MSDGFAEVLTDTCTIQRAAESTSEDLDQIIGAFVTVTEDVACLIVPLQPSDDMIIAGPLPVHKGRLFLATGADIENRDRIVMDDDTVWTVTQPPETEVFRGADHHVEAILEQVPVS